MAYFSIDNDQLECIYALATNSPENVDENGFSYPDEVEIPNHEYLKFPSLFLLDTHGMAFSEALKDLLKSFNIKYVTINVVDSNYKIFKLISSKGPELLHIEDDNSLTRDKHSRITPNEYIFSDYKSKDNYVYPTNNNLWEEVFFSFELIHAINSICGNVYTTKEFFGVSENMAEDDMVNLLKKASFRVALYALSHFKVLVHQKGNFRQYIKVNKSLSAKEKLTLIKTI
jgi:hypothetical protein